MPPGLFACVWWEGRRFSGLENELEQDLQGREAGRTWHETKVANANKACKLRDGLVGRGWLYSVPYGHRSKSKANIEGF